MGKLHLKNWLFGNLFPQSEHQNLMDRNISVDRQEEEISPVALNVVRTILKSLRVLT